MATRRYLNFDLLLEQEGEGRYQARVTDSPLGETPSVRFELPFDATTLENLLLKLDPGRSGTRRVGGTGRQQAAMDFGGPLYRTVFTGDLALAWQRSLDQVRAEQAGGLRLRLRLNDAPAIAGLPWELLYDDRTNNFLAQSERTPLVRFLDVPHVPRPMTVDGPLRVLAVISSPIDLDELDVEAEWARIQEALAPRISSGLVVLDRLPSATLSALGAWLRRAETHVVHFIGHGDFDPGLCEGVIYFQDQAGRRSAVTSSTLGPYLRDHDPLRMVVLNACRSARTDSTDPFGGMAQGLVQQDATAVVAMQFPISDRAAVKFTGEFYGALVDGQPVDQAVSSARKSLLDGFQDEWATPVLFLRSPDGNIFENVHATTGGEPTAATPATQPSPRPASPRPEQGEQPDPSVGVLAWIRGHVPIVAGAALGLLAVVVGLVLLTGGDDPSGGEGDDDSPLALPTSAPLSGGQLIVAAGTKYQDLHIWIADPASKAVTRRLSTGVTVEWLPVVSPDGRTLIYSRRSADSENYVLWTAGADGTNPRKLFDQGTPEPCEASAGRPAWIPVSDELVLRCKDNSGVISLVRVDLHGTLLETYDVVDPARNRLASFGDVTVSGDGKTIVLFASTVAGVQDGSLYKIDVESGVVEQLLPAMNGVTYSDAAFAPEGNLLAYRANLGEDSGGFEVLVAPLEGGSLGTPTNISGLADGRDQDPVFSPDGTQVVYGHMPLDQTTPNQQLYIASVVAPHDPHELLLPDLPPFRAVPAWGRR